MSKEASWPTQVKTYINEVRGEMRRVSWPTWPQVRATTGVVIGTTFILAAYFWVVNIIVNAAINRIIDFFTKH